MKSSIRKLIANLLLVLSMAACTGEEFFPENQDNNEHGSEQPETPDPEQPETPDPEYASSSAWQNFLDYHDNPDWNTENRILQDYSYAGYDHGDTAPPEQHQDWNIFDVTQYGAIPDDGQSDRAAFLSALQAAGVFRVDYTGMNGDPVRRQEADAIIYFPEGEYILHDQNDNQGNTSRSIEINSGHILIKGAGRDKTTICMASPNLPRDPGVLYSSPEMLLFKEPSESTVSAPVVKDSPQGSFEVTLSYNPGFSSGQWVCLALDLNDPSPEVLRYELEGHDAEKFMKNFRQCLQVRDYHQIKSVEGNRIIFHEPLMRGVNLTRDISNSGQSSWKLNGYNHLSEIGVEDLTFKGNAKPDFSHHASWEDDGAYKPLQLTRVVNSWIRRVNFHSITECATFASSAQCSAYDIKIGGNRGHSGIRSNGSSRIFLGKISEFSQGRYIAQGQKPYGNIKYGAGQYHASGVSKPSLGAVLWRNHWGDDATFEAHASQPRATLVDCCKGGWVEWRFGGATNQVPNHLRDLTIWNFEALRFYGRTGQKENYKWWCLDDSEKWRVSPPIVVGFHGTAAPMFDQMISSVSPSYGQMKHFESYGTPVAEESLYEAQMRLRKGGTLPHWLEELKLSSCR